MQIVEDYVAGQEPRVAEILGHIARHPATRAVAKAAFDTAAGAFKSVLETPTKMGTKEEVKVEVHPSKAHRSSAHAGSPAVLNAEHLAAPVATSSRITMPNISVKHTEGGKMVLSGTEMVRDIRIAAGSAFSVDFAASIQPGLTAAFPKASAFATRFQEYRFRKLSFHLATEGSTANLGSIMMAAQTDVNLPTPTQKIDLMALAGATRAPPWADCELTFTKNQLGKWKKIRFGPIQGDFAPGVGEGGNAIGREATNQVDYNNYDSGVLFVGRSNIGYDTNYELYVSYELEFRLPILSQTIVPTALFDSAGPGAGGNAFGALTPTNSRNGTIYMDIDFTGSYIVLGNLVPGREYSYNWSITCGLTSTSTLSAFSGAVKTVSYALASTTQRVETGSFVATGNAALLTMTTSSTGITSNLFVVSEIPYNNFI